MKMKTECLMVFKLEETSEISSFSSQIKSEPFCVPASYFPGMYSNKVKVLDVDESAVVSLHRYTTIYSQIYRDRLKK